MTYSNGSSSLNPSEESNVPLLTIWPAPRQSGQFSERGLNYNTYGVDNWRLGYNNERRQTGFSQPMAESWACIFGVHC